MSWRGLFCGMGVVAVMGLGAGCAHNEEREARAQGERVGRAAAEKAHFADRLAQGDREQIALGQLALGRASNPEVRQFAQTLVQDHQRHLDSLRSIADERSMSLSLGDLSLQDAGVGGAGLEGASKAIKKENRTYDKQSDKREREFFERRDVLAGLSGQDFDRAFLDEVKHDQGLGERLTRQGLDAYRSDTQLGLFLGRTTPMFHLHQQQVETLQGYIGG
jgi:predicted outer membrane protein